MILVAISRHHGHYSSANPWWNGASSFLLYLPVGFIIEEVFFRGGIESYVQREGDRASWFTAIAVSCLWGWWHMPIFHARNVAEVVALAIGCPLICCVTGVPFSLHWRQSGSLFMSATVHAVVDGIRNGLLS